MPPLNGSASAAAICQAIEHNGSAAGGLIAVAFLRWLDPTGVHHVVAFDPSGKKQIPVGKITCSLDGDGAKRIAEFVDQHNGKNNLYFQVNAPRPDFAGYKASDRDIVWLRAIPADKDPEGRGDITQERIANVQSLADRLAGCRPSCITDSGNGHWAFFRLADQMPNNDENSGWYRAQCRAVSTLLCSDSIGDLSRIARLPGTFNVPDAVKRSKGRTIGLASVFVIDDLAFTRATLEQAFPPIWEAPLTDRDPRVRELMDLYQGAHYQLASLETLDPELRARLDADLAATPILAEMSRGDFSNTKQKGAGGKRNSYATNLGSYGSGYSPDEFAEVVWAVFSENFEPDYCDQQFDVRQMARLRESHERAESTFKARSKSSPVDIGAVYEKVPPRELKLPRGVRSIDTLIDATAIPQRKYVLYPALLEGDVCQVVGEPGISKSSLMITFGLAIAGEREDLICGKDGQFGSERLHRSGPAIIFNAEDRIEEMERRLVVAQRAAGITKMKHKVHFWSGIDGDDLQIMARTGKDGPLARSAKADFLEDLIVHTGAAFVALDPQVGLMSGGHENDADDMNALFAELTRISTKHKCAIMVVHHSAKSTRNDASDMGMGRGSFAQAGKVRSQLTLTNVSADDAVRWGFSPHDDLFQLG